jgi:protein SCO1/2
LRNYTGQRVSLAALHGEAVFVTFVYTHCPDVCPLIVSNLAAAYHALPASETRRVQIIAVTVDPRRDTPAAIRKYLSARGATGTMDYLIGSFPQLMRIWRAWGIAVSIGRTAVSAGHSAIVFGITASGRVTAVYPPNFTPGQIEHDVPLLAAE